MGIALMIGALLLISVGTGLFKGNLQVLVGNLYDDPKYSSRRDAAFSLFYMAINIGAMFAPSAATAITNKFLSSAGLVYKADIPALAHQYLDGTITAANSAKLAGLQAVMPSPEVTSMPAADFCSYYIENASFLRLDNMSIGYTFDTKNIDWLEKARVYVAAQNLFVITGYKGLDPEVENFRGEASDSNAGLSPGIEPRNYMPKARSFTFGVNLTF